MDELIHTTLDQIALEGREGCTVPQLWDRLSSLLPVGGLPRLNDPVKEFLWGIILDRSQDVLLCLPGVDLAEPSTTGSRAKKKKEVEGPSYLQVPRDSSDVRTHQEAAAKGIVLVASPALLWTALNLYDASECRFQISDSQLRALELVARSRHRGVVQSDLATQLNIPHRNFFYVTRQLEVRGLMVKNPIITPHHSNRSNHSVTNILHLKRFAPGVTLAPGQCFRQEVRSEEGNAQVLGTATYTVQDDNQWLQLISDTIAAASERVVGEREVKQALGFRMTKGHRTWRRLRDKMIKMGLLEAFIGSVDGKPTSCLKLLKVYGQCVDDDEAPEEDEEEGVGHLVVEQSLDRQIINMIVKAGPDGITNVDVFRALRLNPKNNTDRLVDLVKRFQIELRVENVGKVILNRLVAPPSLIAEYGGKTGSVGRNSSNLPGRPASQLNLTDRLPVDPDHEGARATPAPVPMPGLPSIQTSQQLAVLDQIMETPLQVMHSMFMEGIATPGMRGALHEGEVANDADLMGFEADAEEEDEEVPQPKRKPEVRAFSHLAQHQLGITPSLGGPEDQDRAPTKPRKLRLLTCASDRRVALLLRLLEARKFILRQEVRSLVLKHEEEEGIIPPGAAPRTHGPDRKTVARVLDRVEQVGRARRVWMTTTAVTNVGDPQALEVMVRTGVDVDAELLKEVAQYNEAFQRRIRQDSTLKHYAERVQKRGDSLPVVQSMGRLHQEGQTPSSFGVTCEVAADPLGAAGAGESAQMASAQLKYNGYLNPRMIRTRLLHYMICRLVGLGGFEPAVSVRGTEAEQCLPRWQQPLAGFMRPKTPLPGASGGNAPTFTFASRDASLTRNPASTKATSDLLPNLTPGDLYTSHGSKYTFSARQLWDALPLSLALQVVGTSHKVDNLLELCSEGKSLGDLAVDEQTTIFDPQSRQRLSYLLNVLHRMGLVRSLVTSHPKVQESTGLNLFVVESVAELEELVGLSEQLNHGEGVVQRHDEGQEGLGCPDHGYIKERRRYNIEYEQELDDYWGRLEYLFTSKSKVTSLQRTCFPANQVPELLSRSGWVTNRLMSTLQWLSLVRRLEQETEQDSLTFARAREIADDLKLNYHQVCRVVYDKRKKVNMDRAKQGLAPLPDTKRLGTIRSGSGGSMAQASMRGLAAINEEEQVQGSTRKRKRGPRDMPRNYRRRSSMETSTLGLVAPPPTTEPEADLEEPLTLQHIPSIRIMVDNNLMHGSEPPQLPLTSGVDLAGPSGSTEPSTNVLDDTPADPWMLDEGMSTDGAATDTTVPMRMRPRRRRRRWVPGEDRAVLKAYVVYRVEKGCHAKVEHAHMRHIPAHLGSHCYQRRIQYLHRKRPEFMRQLMERCKAIHSSVSARRQALKEMLIEATTPGEAPSSGLDPILGDVSAMMSSQEIIISLNHQEQTMMKQLFGVIDTFEHDERGGSTPQPGEVDDPMTDLGLPRVQPLRSSRLREAAFVGVPRRKGGTTTGNRLALEERVEDHQPPSLVVCNAMELIKSLLWMSEAQEEDWSAALMARFTQEDIAAALSLLHRRGIVLPNSARKPFQISAYFKQKLSLEEAPSGLFEEAAVSWQVLSVYMPNSHSILHEGNRTTLDVEAHPHAHAMDPIVQPMDADQSQTLISSRGLFTGLLDINSPPLAFHGGHLGPETGPRSSDQGGGQKQVGAAAQVASTSPTSCLSPQPCEDPFVQNLAVTVTSSLQQSQDGRVLLLRPDSAILGGLVLQLVEGMANNLLALGVRGTAAEGLPGAGEDSQHVVGQEGLWEVEVSEAAPEPSQSDNVVQGVSLGNSLSPQLLVTNPIAASHAAPWPQQERSLAVSGHTPSRPAADISINLEGEVLDLLRSKGEEGASVEELKTLVDVHRHVSGVRSIEAGGAEAAAVPILPSSPCSPRQQTLMASECQTVDSAADIVPSLNNLLSHLNRKGRVLRVNSLITPYWVAREHGRKYQLGNQEATPQWLMPAVVEGEPVTGAMQPEADRLAADQHVEGAVGAKASQVSHGPRCIRPWLDHQGRVNLSLWRSLVKKILSLIARHPGVPLKMIQNQLEVISAANVHEVVDHLVEQGFIRVLHHKMPPLTPALPRLLRSKSLSHSEGKSVEIQFYFPILQKSISDVMQLQPP